MCSAVWQYIWVCFTRLFTLNEDYRALDKQIFDDNRGIFFLVFHWNHNSTNDLGHNIILCFQAELINKNYPCTTMTNCVIS